ncbi:MAG: hypothetical protein IPG71_10105 [bacterium]|nr:hypothetical protein [bacterium]
MHHSSDVAELRAEVLDGPLILNGAQGLQRHDLITAPRVDNKVNDTHSA